MAPKKTAPVAAPVAAKKTAKPTKPTTTAIIPWDKKFAGYAKAAVEQEKNVGGGSQSIKFGPGTITVAGGTVPNGRLECVVLGSCAANTLYEGAYDPDDVQPPVCYAFAVLDADLAPHADCQKPQSETCATCEQNMFGSAPPGRGKARGKACGNTRRLGLLLASDVEEADGIATAETAMAKVSPTNLKAWAGYVRSLADAYGRPPWAVVTEISSHPDPKTQIRLEFSMVSLIEDDDVLNALEARQAKVQDVLQQPYGPPIERPAPPARGKPMAGKAAAKPAARPVGRR